MWNYSDKFHRKSARRRRLSRERKIREKLFRKRWDNLGWDWTATFRLRNLFLISWVRLAFSPKDLNLSQSRLIITKHLSCAMRPTAPRVGKTSRKRGEQLKLDFRPIWRRSIVSHRISTSLVDRVKSKQKSIVASILMFSQAREKPKQMRKISSRAKLFCLQLNVETSLPWSR